MSNIILFSTGCPKCNVLKKKLDTANIEYIVIDDINQMMSLGITTVPVLKVDGEMLSYTDAVKYVNKGGIK